MKRVRKGAVCLPVLTMCLAIGLQDVRPVSAAEKSRESRGDQGIVNEANMLYIPRLDTTVYDVDSGTHVSQADSDVTVIDEVRYENLVPGREYVLQGTLVSQKTRRIKTDVRGGKITAQAVFTPAKAKGSLELAFRFDGSECAGETVAVYEELSYNGKVIAEHEEAENSKQAVYFLDTALTMSDGRIGEKSILGKGFAADTMDIPMKLLCIYVFLFLICAGMLVKMELYSR